MGIQFLLCLKNFISVIIAKYANDTIDIDTAFYVQLFALIPFVILLFRAILLKPVQAEELDGDLNDINNGFSGPKLSMQNYGRSYAALNGDIDYSKSRSIISSKMSTSNQKMHVHKRTA